MTQLLTSLENETEVKSIERNNNLFEKKCASFDKQRYEIARSMQNLELCNSYVRPMLSITKEKLHGTKMDAEKYLRETRETVQRSNNLLNTSFEQVDVIRADYHHSRRFGVPSLSISLPYENCIEKLKKNQEELVSHLQEVAKKNDILKSDKERLEKLQHSTSKAKGKIEKEIISLTEEYQRQTDIISELQISSSSNKDKLLNARQEISVATDDKNKLETELRSEELIRDDLLQKCEIGGGLIESRRHIAALDEFHSNLSSESGVFDSSSIINSSDFNLFKEIFRQLEATRNDVPGPEPYQPYRTPSHKAPKDSKKNVTTTKVPVRSGPSRHISNSSSPYPGIQLTQKKSNDGPVFHENDPIEDDNEANISDSTSLHEDTGATQDEGEFDILFDKLEESSPQDVVEFSMAEHMDDYSQRQANKKSSQISSDHVDIHEKNKSDHSGIESDADEEENEDEDVSMDFKLIFIEIFSGFVTARSRRFRSIYMG
uniref:DUF5741 domain-containing protein n=1 Tax=Caenorhabditis tropicalis TaxID=1561998 RepID=A0A1I7UKZ1_9PELO